MDSKSCMIPSQSQGNPTTFGGFIKTSLSQGVHLSLWGGGRVGGEGVSHGSLQGREMHQDQALILPDGFPDPAVGGRAAG